MKKGIKKPRVDYVVMKQEELEEKYPEYAKMIRAFNHSLRGHFSEKGKAHCLCCRRWIKWNDMKVGLLCFAVTGEPVPIDDDRYKGWMKIMRYCPTRYCDGFGYDWSPYEWKEEEWGP